MDSSSEGLLCVTIKNAYDLKPILPNKILIPPLHFLASRLHYKTDYFSFASASEKISELMKSNIPQLSWEDCCLKRASDLLALNKDQYIISYSGGIDSTVALVSLLRAWPTAEHKRICISLSHHSIEENPSFFKFVKNFKLRNSLLDPSQELLNSNSLFVTGELGDQLFGSDILMLACEKLGDSILKAPYKEYASKIFEIDSKQTNVGLKMFEHIHPIVEEAPFPIKTNHDFFWWFNFSQKWQNVKYRFTKSSTWDLRAQYNKHIVHFYDTPYFQKWSINNHDLKIKNTWDSYKFTAKKFIHDFTNDPKHLELLKVQSLVSTFMLSKQRIAINAHYQEISNLEELKYYVFE